MLPPDHALTIDFESTNVDPKIAHAVEVAIFGNRADYECFIKPPIPIPPETSAVHHITDADVCQARTWEEVKADLAEFLTAKAGNKLPVLVAHNAAYEKDIIGEDFPPVLWICTYKCALRVWPDAPSHKNEVLRYWLELGDDRGRGGATSAHSAMHDARVTFLILQKLLDVATLEELIEWTDQPAKLPHMPMGKHFKQKWDTIPAPYLEWCVKTVDLREDVRVCAKEELDRRKKAYATQRSS